MLPREAKNRAAVGAIGSLGGGGLVALFGFMLTPYLNNHVRVILVIGTSLYTLGLSLAAGSTRVRESSIELSVFTDCKVLALVSHTGPNRWNRLWSRSIPTVHARSGMVFQPVWDGNGHHNVR
jgi:hypothetical protein